MARTNFVRNTDLLHAECIQIFKEKSVSISSASISSIVDTTSHTTYRQITRLFWCFFLMNEPIVDEPMIAAGGRGVILFFCIHWSKRSQIFGGPHFCGSTFFGLFSHKQKFIFGCGRHNQRNSNVYLAKSIAICENEKQNY